jgi:hypothetical protein
MIHCLIYWLKIGTGDLTRKSSEQAVYKRSEKVVNINWSLMELIVALLALSHWRGVCSLF